LCENNILKPVISNRGQKIRNTQAGISPEKRKKEKKLAIFFVIYNESHIFANRLSIPDWSGKKEIIINLYTI